jgi:hypothetical protein
MSGKALGIKTLNFPRRQAPAKCLAGTGEILIRLAAIGPVCGGYDPKGLVILPLEEDRPMQRAYLKSAG